MTISLIFGEIKLAYSTYPDLFLSPDCLDALFSDILTDSDKTETLLNESGFSFDDSYGLPRLGETFYKILVSLQSDKDNAHIMDDAYAKFTKGKNVKAKALIKEAIECAAQLLDIKGKIFVWDNCPFCNHPLDFYDDYCAGKNAGKLCNKPTAEMDAQKSELEKLKETTHKLSDKDYPFYWEDITNAGAFWQIKQQIIDRQKVIAERVKAELIVEAEAKVERKKKRKKQITISGIVAGALSIFLFFGWLAILPTMLLNFTWKVENKAITVTGLKNDVTSIEIPNNARVSWQFNNLPVAAIAPNAFQNNVQLRQVTLPSTLNKMGENSFANCTSLTYIYLASEAPPTLGDSAFSGSPNLNIMVAPSLFSAYSKNSEWMQYYNIIYPNYDNGSGYYCVVIDVNGGSDISSGGNTGLNKLDNNNQIFAIPQASSGTTVSIKEPTLHGYTFAGWELPNGEIFSLTTAVNRNLKLKARWVPQDRSLIFEYNGATSGNELQNKNVSYDVALGQLPEPQRTGYTFLGWYNNANFTGSTYTSETIFKGLEDLKLYARWQVNVFTVTFDYQDGRANTTANVEYDSAIGSRLPINVVKPGDNLFGGWWTEVGGGGIQYTAETKYLLTQGITLYAKWETAITFDYQGGDSTGLADGWGAVYNALITGIPIAVTRSGYTFDGWWTEVGGGGRQIINNALYTESGAIMLYAKWKTTITLNPVGGVVSPTQIEVVYNKAIGTLPDPAKSNVRFDGWFTSEAYTTKFISSTLYLENGAITLYAKWIATLIFDYEGADGGNTSTLYIEVSDGVVIGGGRLPQPTKTGHKFGGWFEQRDGQGNEYTPLTAFAGNVNKVAYAYWILEHYKISYNSNGGSAVSDLNTFFGENITSLPTPTREGYRFDGWFFQNTSGNGSGTQFTTGVVGDLGDYPANGSLDPIPVTLYAKWTLEFYKFTFVSNGGSSVTSRDVNYNATYTFSTPTREGYHFDGWFRSNTGNNGSGAQFSTSGTMPDMGDYGAEITLYAKWTLELYTLKFNTNGGSAVGDINTNYGANLTSLPTSLRDGYRFDGWFRSNTNNNGSGTQFTTGVVGDLGDYPSGDTSNRISVNLYAKWTLITATFYGNGTQADPYRLYYATQLFDIADQVNGTNGYTANNFSGKYFAVQNNISLAGAVWIPIGNNNHEAFHSTTADATLRRFAGVFDGGNHVISDYEVTRASQTRDGDTFVGLFGYIGQGGIVRNLRVSGFSIDGESRRGTGSKGGTHHGGIAGVSSGIIENVIVENGTVNGRATLDTHHGGIVGYMFMTDARIIRSDNGLFNASNNHTIGSGAFITGSAGRSTSHGGIVGSVNNGVIYICRNGGEISGSTDGTGNYGAGRTNYRFHGGIAGVACALIIKSHNAGTVNTGIGGNPAHGNGGGIIVGYLHNGSDGSIGSNTDDTIQINQIPNHAHYSALISNTGTGATHFIGFLQSDSNRQLVAVTSDNNSVRQRISGHSITVINPNFYDDYLSNFTTLTAMLQNGYFTVPANFIITDSVSVIEPNDNIAWWKFINTTDVILGVGILFVTSGIVLLIGYYIKSRKRKKRSE